MSVVVGKQKSAFTLIEIIVIIAIISILVTIVSVVYVGITQNAVSSKVETAVRDAGEAVTTQMADDNEIPTALPSDYRMPSVVTVIFVPESHVYYSNLNAVQQGVLLYDICKNLISNPTYTTIHSKDGTQTSTVIASCDDSVSHSSMLVTSWDSKTWNVPVQKSTLQSYINSVSYDSWWTDKQSVIQGFYTALISDYESAGGVWPITSFWDPWANGSNGGVQKQDLPAPSADPRSFSYCIQAASVDHPGVIYKVDNADNIAKAGPCPV